MSAIMAATVGHSSKKSVNKRKLDALGNFRGQCSFANDPARMKKLKMQLDLAASLESIAATHIKNKELKTKNATAGLLDLAEGALEKLKSKGGDLSKITKEETCSLALRYFGTALKSSEKKDQLSALLRGLIKETPHALGLTVEELAVANSGAAAAIAT